MQPLIAKLENSARNGLHSVMGMLELLAQGPLTTSQREYLSVCRSSTDRVLRTIQNVVELLSTENEVSLASEFDLQKLLAEIAGITKILAERKGLEFTFELRLSGIQRALGDRASIEDVLLRLIENAVGFTERGAIRLIAATTSDDTNAIHAEFEIHDTGPGIPAAVLSRASEPITPDSAGLGFGLPVAYKLVRKMRGSLSISSKEGIGTRASISLPLKIAAIHTTSETPAVSSSGASEKPREILVAEDSDDSYYVLEAYLQGQPYRLSRAIDGMRAVEMFKAARFDLVLLDVHMPTMDGYSAAHAMRFWETGQSRARLPIIILSSDSPANQIGRGARAGCSAYLTKPVSRAALLNVLNRYTRSAAVI